MKNLKAKFTKALVVLFVGSSVLIACEKDNVNQEVPRKTVDIEKSSQLKEIEVLKSYLSDITGIKVVDISYDEVTTQFKAFGVNQISKERLTNSYTRNNK